MSSGYPTFQDIIGLGYPAEAARNTLRVIDENGGDPFLYWKALREGGRDARPPYGWSFEK